MNDVHAQPLAIYRPAAPVLIPKQFVRAWARRIIAQARREKNWVFAYSNLDAMANRTFADAVLNYLTIYRAHARAL